MNREEKNALSRQRILEAALREFAQKGYEASSLNTFCAQNEISKGVLYHHFRDKDALYLECVADCFAALCAHLDGQAQCGTPEQRLRAYFDARMQYFLANPLQQALFADVTLNPAKHLAGEIARCREAFDAQNLAVLTALMCSAPLRAGLDVPDAVQDIRLYIDFFHTRAFSLQAEGTSLEAALRNYEERCRRQITMLLYGVWAQKDE